MTDAATTRNLKIDGARLWSTLEEMARIGATDKGGVCRLAATHPCGRARSRAAIQSSSG